MTDDLHNFLRANWFKIVVLAFSLGAAFVTLEVQISAHDTLLTRHVTESLAESKKAVYLLRTICRQGAKNDPPALLACSRYEDELPR